ncbi:MAG: helix-turn-helix transcriptional regulator [Henriciella sp.]
MELSNAVRRLSALAQPNRLEVYRLLVKAGKQGIAAGDIARALDVAPNTLSAQLNILSNSGLVTSVREGRSIIYAADFKNMGDLLVYLVEDCCNGNPEICLPIAEATKCLDGGE